MADAAPLASLKVAAALLSYPSEELIAALPELNRALADDGFLSGRRAAGSAPAALSSLIDQMKTADLYDLQERYVELFDRTRSLSLHLFEHVHGEGRDRGQAMIDLKNVYESHGLFMASTDLPDYLPMFLEFLSTLPRAEAADYLGQIGHILEALGERLAKRQSPYQAVFALLTALAATRPTEAERAAIVSEPDDDPNDLTALDAAWEDEEVRFGPGAQAATDSCGTDALTARMRHAKRALPTTDNPRNLAAQRGEL